MEIFIKLAFLSIHKCHCI